MTQSHVLPAKPMGAAAMMMSTMANNGMASNQQPSSSPFGLAVHYYNYEDINCGFPPLLQQGMRTTVTSEEPPSLLIDCAITATANLQIEVASFLQVQQLDQQDLSTTATTEKQQLNSSPSAAMTSNVNEALKYVQQLLHKFKQQVQEHGHTSSSSSNSSNSNDSNTSKQEHSSAAIMNFNFAGRGLLISLIHLMCNMHKDFKKIQALNTGTVVLAALTTMHETLSVTRIVYDYLLQVHANELVTGQPFMHTNILESQTVQQLQISPFLQNIGTQYSPGYRAAMSQLVKIVAAHNDTHKFVAAALPSAASASSSSSSSSSWPLISALNNSTTNNLLFLARFGAMQSFYQLNNTRAAVTAAQYYANITLEQGKHLWRMADNEIVAKMQSAILPSIRYVKDVEIENFDVNHSIKSIEEAVAQWKQQYCQQPDRVNNNEANSPMNTSTDTLGPYTGTSTEITLEEYLNQAIEMTKYLKSTNVSSKSVRKQFTALRVLSNLPSLQVNHGTTFSSLFSNLKTFTSSIFKQDGNEQKVYTAEERIARGTLMIHCHGGGFVAMTPNSHELYLRQWVKETNITIVSINYAKAPEFQWPECTEECYSAYKWIIANAELFLPPGQKLERVVVAGDSAGGNLSLSVVNRAILDKYSNAAANARVPDALILTYPASTVSVSASTSRLLSISEPLMNAKLLNLCVQAYIPKPMQPTAHMNAFISPGLAPTEILKHYPATYVNCGALDPLSDDSIFVARRIAHNNGGKVFMDYYDGLSHGYLNMAMTLLPDCQAASNNVTAWLMKYLKELQKEQ